MYAVGRLGSYISRGVYTVAAPFHPFGGAVDIIVVEQPDGSFKSSPWYVRFGKFQGVLKSKEKVISINVNGLEADFHMHLHHNGEAYFLRNVDGEVEETVLYHSSTGDEADEQSSNTRKTLKSKSLNYLDGKSSSDDLTEVSTGKVLTTTGPRRSPILGLLFGRRSMEDSTFKEGEGDVSVERVNSLERAEIAADLLDVKWSTNPTSKKEKKDKTARLSTGGVSDEKSLSGDSWSGVESTECSLVDDGIEMSCFSSASGQSMLRDEHEVVSKMFKSVDLFCIENDENGVKLKNITCEMASSDPEILEELEASKRVLLVDKTNALALLPGSGLFEEESESEKAQSFLYCATLENSIVGLNGSDEKTHENTCVAGEGHSDVHIHAESLLSLTELLPEDTVSEQENVMELGLEETLPLLESIMQEVSAEPTIVSVEKVDPEIICTTSGGSNLCYQTEDENSITGDLHPLRVFDDSPQLDGECSTTKSMTILSSESSEEEQFHFTDLDDSKLCQGHSVNSICLDHAKTNGGYRDMANSVAEDCEPCSTLDQIVRDSLLANLENLMEKSRMITSPISISRGHRIVDDKDDQQGNSLPNLWQPSYKLHTHEIHPLSHSEDSRMHSLKWKYVSEDDFSFMKSDNNIEKQNRVAQGKVEQQLANKLPNSEDEQNSEEIKRIFGNPELELSLCKHLLHEGMGADSASRAFDAERLDTSKFSSLGPTVLRNDRLVLRIGGCYFSWEAASRTTLRLVCFESTGISEPEGMICIDGGESFCEADPSKACGTPCGGWRLWPFSFKQSRSIKVIHPNLSTSRSFNAESSSRDIVAHDRKQPKAMKKMKRTNTPTYEQLASLDLKEGRNTVTFTFSTAMLGKQQVHARIFLWKWNKRIVISDVDGTITKSDVLGQFLPLVGRDWSQTGVTHLFSAIKENGYQFLFLSARAISQASITRQFLINLKQDGKALPEGPVVISPDGLFPSLYREVIRRAPHEFKIACLEDIKALFPSDCNPFYAGFGNRDTDEVSYFKVGIPRGKIFIINPKGQVAVNRRLDNNSYTSLHALVNGMFPVMCMSEQEDFNSWNYWKLPPCSV